MPFLTIRQIIDEGHQIGAYCVAPCWHSQMLDLEAIGNKLGYDFIVSADSLNPLLRCSKCGGKDVTMRFHQKVTPIAMFDTHGRIQGAKD